VSYLDDPFDFVRPARTKPEPTPKEKAERHKRQVFAQESSQGRQHVRSTPPERGIVERSETCVIDELGHIAVGRRCPHGLPKNQEEFDQVHELEL
jgi:hypothetical protein